MSDTLYIQASQNVQVNHPHVCLQDIAELSCSNDKILNRIRVMPVVHFDHDKPGRYVISVIDLIRMIRQKEPSLNINNIGEPDFIITYQISSGSALVWEWCKAAFVCLTAFFGAGFSIMTFNNDVDVGSLFSQLYTQVTGKVSSGFTILEISYSLGISIGVLFFFNHFSGSRKTKDPSPMQIQMRLYENDVNTSIIETEEKSKSNN